MGAKEQTNAILAPGLNATDAAVHAEAARVRDLLAARGERRLQGTEAAQLSRAAAPLRVAIVMSDCLATAGGELVTALCGIDRLHVLGICADPESVRRGQDPARRAGGRYLPATTFAQLGTGLDSVLN